MTAVHDNAMELRRQEIQAGIDAGRSASARNRLGQFATPNALAVDIARFAGTLLPADEHPRIRFADPAIGSGSFFSAALAAFGAGRLESAIGIEIDPVFSGAASELWAQAGLEVINGDFTRIIAQATRPPAPNFVLANPPYVRHHHVPREEKERLQALTQRLTGVSVNGLAGLYVYFVLLATAWMEADGIAAWLIPSEFMDVNYGSALKTYLLDQVTLLRAHRFDPHDVQFGDALVSSVVVFLRKTRPLPNHEIEFTFGGTLLKPHASERVSRDDLRQTRKWSSYPSHSENGQRTQVDGPLLGELFKVRRGIATGNNRFFIMEYGEAKRRGLPREYLRPILPSPRLLKTTVIDADDRGNPLITPQLCIIDCDLPEPILELRHPALWEYLKTADVLGIKEGYLVGKRVPWYKQERRAPAPILCTYMGRGTHDARPFRFVWNRSRAIGTNLYLMLYPQNHLAEMLRRDPARIEEVFALLGQITGYEMRGEGRVYGGGLHKIEPSELCRISAAPFVRRWPELTGESVMLQEAGLFD